MHLLLLEIYIRIVMSPTPSYSRMSRPAKWKYSNIQKKISHFLVRRNRLHEFGVARLQWKFTFLLVRLRHKLHCNGDVVVHLSAWHTGSSGVAHRLVPNGEFWICVIYLIELQLTHFHPNIQEFVNNAISAMMYTAAFIIQISTWVGIISNHPRAGTNIIGGFFGLLNALAYAASSYYLYLIYKYEHWSNININSNTRVCHLESTNFIRY